MSEFEKGYKQALSEIKNKVNDIINGLSTHCNPDPMGSMQECLAYSEIEALKLVLETIENSSSIEHKQIKKAPRSTQGSRIKSFGI